MDQDEVAIEFLTSDDLRDVIPEPVPSSDELPMWYKMLDMKTDSNDVTNGTVRSCPAFLDALSLGWMLRMPSKTKINTEDADFAVDGDFVSQKSVSEGLPEEAVSSFFVDSGWSVDVPDGYSVLVLSPLNRRERRYDVVERVIDMDGTMESITVPIIWYADGARTIIREEEPLAQVIPFKRNSRLEDAVVKQMSDEDKLRYTRNRNKTGTNPSFYRQNEWEPKGTRMEGGELDA